MKLKIKPLSVNKAWLGRRTKSVAYRKYEVDVCNLLPDEFIIPDDKLTFNINIGLSSKLSDIDNVLKPFIDILQKKYNFNDKMIFKLIIEKQIVTAGNEFIEFKIDKYEEND